MTDAPAARTDAPRPVMLIGALLILLGFVLIVLYAGTTEQFRADAQMHRIAEELRPTEVAAPIFGS